jgi:hypothetical protein
MVMRETDKARVIDIKIKAQIDLESAPNDTLHRNFQMWWVTYDTLRTHLLWSGFVSRVLLRRLRIFSPVNSRHAFTLARNPENASATIPCSAPCVGYSDARDKPAGLEYHALCWPVRSRRHGAACAGGP